MSTNRYGLRFYALGGGFFCISLAAFVQGVLPMLEPESRTDKVTKVVRTDLGELKWMQHRASDYTPLELRGRAVYTREGCWYCHSQYVRPVTGETRRWGPVTQAGEYAYDLPHMFSTRRIGPDLSRVGLKYSNAWHLAHFWNPRMLSPDSIMPRFTALFEGPHTAKIVTDAGGNRTLAKTPATEKLFDFKTDQQILLTPNAERLLYVPDRDKYRLTPSGSLPDEGDLLRTITRGVRGTAMPSWHELPEKDRLAVIQYIKYELAVDRSSPGKPYLFFVEEPPKAPIYIPAPPKPSV